MATTSAEPDDLDVFVDATAERVPGLRTTAGDLKEALDTFRSSAGREEFVADVPELDLDLGFYGDRWEGLGEWIADVAQQFRDADDGSDLITIEDSALDAAVGRYEPPEAEVRLDSDGRVIVDAGPGDDEIDIRYGPFGSVTVTINGEEHTLTGDAAADVVVRGGSGDNTIDVDRGLLGSQGAGALSIDAGDGNNTIDVQGNVDTDIHLGDGDNQITALGDRDTNIVAGDGNNTIVTGAGDDTILAGDGNNTIVTGAGDDSVVAGDGDNEILAGYSAALFPNILGGDPLVIPIPLDDGGTNTIQTGNGDNTIRAGSGNDTITTGTGNDTIYTGGGVNTVESLGGDNTIRLDGDANLVTTGDGNDTIFGGEGNDTVRTAGGDNYIDMTVGGNNIVETGDGDDTIYGSPGNDTIRTEGGDNLIFGFGGDNRIFGGDGNDTIYGGDGDNLIMVGGADPGPDGTGGNAVYTGPGDDTIFASNPTDQLYVTPGDEVIGAIPDANVHEREVDLDILDEVFDFDGDNSEAYDTHLRQELVILASSPTGQAMLEELQATGDTIELSEDAPNEGALGTYSDHKVRYDIHPPGRPQKPPIMTLFHELTHAYNDLTDTYVDGYYVGTDLPDEVTVEDDDGNPVTVDLTGIGLGSTEDDLEELAESYDLEVDDIFTPNRERQAVGLTVTPRNDDDGYTFPDVTADAVVDHPPNLSENGLREEMGVPERTRYGSAG